MNPSSVQINDDPNAVKRAFDTLTKNWPAKKTLPLSFRIQ